MPDTRKEAKTATAISSATPQVESEATSSSTETDSSSSSHESPEDILEDTLNIMYPEEYETNFPPPPSQGPVRKTPLQPSAAANQAQFVCTLLVSSDFALY